MRTKLISSQRMLILVVQWAKFYFTIFYDNLMAQLKTFNSVDTREQVYVEL